MRAEELDRNAGKGSIEHDKRRYRQNIASEYFDDKESEHEMDEVFDLAKKALEERKEVKMTNVEIIEQLENAIDLIKQDGKDWLDDRDIPILEACIKSLTALDKIRLEIMSMDFDFGDYYDHTNEIIEMVCKTIDKYNAERCDSE